MVADKCSKCHVADKILPSFPPRAAAQFDHWCWECYADAPLLERIPKLSKAKKRKLIEKQQQQAIKKAEQRAEFLKQQELKRAAAAKNKAASAPRNKAKKGFDLPFTLDLEFVATVEAVPEIEMIDYDALRQRISEVRDPTIFDEELSDDWMYLGSRHTEVPKNGE